MRFRIRVLPHFDDVAGVAFESGFDLVDFDFQFKHDVRGNAALKDAP